MFSFLRGYRTYLVGIGFLISALVKAIDGDYTTALQLAGEGLGAMTLRAALSKGAIR